ncbi:DNA cross-link repair protein pso2/snm1 [Blumeria hordei DH14]|uniref:DNA cross-link repair protein pso2/snm1 n=1 Tax=Blumeria graminis f. sp. hordei (strain DH14) TaxID=546991 RepID=N1JGK2_BLUG1|nr:DNA cross-link repair protein pso2/snm1 [Blumeria hordei DH14]
MFRNPRENLNLSTQNSLKPSIGRPPTPPPAREMATSGLPQAFISQSNVKSASPSLRKPSSSKKHTSIKINGKPNTSILSFFKKVDSPIKDDSMFISSRTNPSFKPPVSCTSGFEADLISNIIREEEEGYENLRFNEVASSIKKQKISSHSILNDKKDTVVAVDLQSGKSSKDPQERAKCTLALESHVKPKQRRIGPFLSDSGSDSDENNYVSTLPTTKALANKGKIAKNTTLCVSVDIPKEQMTPVGTLENQSISCESNETEAAAEEISNGQIDNLKKEPLYSNENLGLQMAKLPENTEEIQMLTSPLYQKLKVAEMDEWADFERENLLDGDLVDGEELLLRKWMHRQAKLEDNEITETCEEFDEIPDQSSESLISTVCPVCNVNFHGVKEDIVSRHVNKCLDVNDIISSELKREPEETKESFENAKNHFSRKAAIARPSQSNPFEIGTTDTKQSSAFLKLMSSKAEDTAWENAAALENSSKGKPAYKRTCPFYKIIPGFNICVDAFRYGAVQGCHAYFLSHFHSDHYIGLTSSWCHGPIYCSKVTANLVKQQLRVDSKYVIPLEFERRVEIPGLQKVTVFMISANHCPGSSLFLFEKITGLEPSPRSQRVLHCGDFRACPAHITHPLLMPDLVDSITGKVKQQKIDVCYLDTTYLNPRFAFPPQEQVIQACAKMCVSLANDNSEEFQPQDFNKHERADSTKSKFFTSAITKIENKDLAKTSSNKSRRGRLLIVCGTYSIGKERICLGIARALDCKIFAPARKLRLCSALEDEELMSRLTKDPREAQIHMQMLMEIRAETLQEYLESYKPHFSRIVGFRPSGWTYKPPTTRSMQAATVPQILTSPLWRSSFSLSDLTPQKGSNRETTCFGVPYSEHSSFRELTLFVCALRIEKIIPTVNVGSAAGRARMKGWIDRWLAERRKNGPIKIGDGKDEIEWF